MRRGRAEFLHQFPSVARYADSAGLDAPGDPATFERSKLNLSERQTHAADYRLHRDLLRLRRQTAAFREQRQGAVDGAVLSTQAFVLRFTPADPAEPRLLLVNLGADLTRPSFAEPLLAPLESRAWDVQWSSLAPEYGGGGMGPVFRGGRWCVPAESATVLAPVDKPPADGSVQRQTA